MNQGQLQGFANIRLFELVCNRLFKAGVAVTTINAYEGCSVLDPNERLVKSYTLNVNGEMGNMTLDLGTTLTLTVS